MTGTGAHALGTCLDHDIGSLGDGSCSIHHIINDDHILVFHVTDDLHRGHYVSTGTGLVAEHQGYSQEFGIGVGTLGTAYVGRSNHQVLEFQTLQVGQNHA